MYTYCAKLIRVIDGDTLDIEVDLGFQICTQIRVRLAGIDTPEMWGVKKESEEYAKGLAAKDFVEEWFSTRERVVVKTDKDKKGKYGRWIASIADESGKHILNEELVSSGHAVKVFYG